MQQWTDICNTRDILPNSGRAALHKGRQVAIFRIREGADTHDTFYAVQNFCPFSEANVLSRGIVGSIGDAVVVASPVYKQHFCLRSGQCIEDESQKLHVWPVQVNGDRVQLAG